jgi:feruloyl esterase
MMGPFGSTDPASEPPFCRVAITLKPSGDSDIKMEIWLPLTTWNEKFFGAGNFGWGGSIRYDGLLLGLKNGYVTASNNAESRGWSHSSSWRWKMRASKCFAAACAGLPFLSASAFS